MRFLNKKWRENVINSQEKKQIINKNLLHFLLESVKHILWGILFLNTNINFHSFMSYKCNIRKNSVPSKNCIYTTATTNSTQSTTFYWIFCQ